MAGVLGGTGFAPASASACQSWTGGAQPPSPGTTFNALQGVSVISACDAWAVGFEFSGSGTEQTLIEHWDGSAWKVVSSPDPGSNTNVLTSVRAVSATCSWAVGSYSDSAGYKTLILHWNGTKWRRVPSPNSSAPVNSLAAVAAASRTDVWAVGSFGNGAANQPLALHCC
jgi:hypothetical protein